MLFQTLQESWEDEDEDKQSTAAEDPKPKPKKIPLAEKIAEKEVHKNNYWSQADSRFYLIIHDIKHVFR